jgi:hypothetical protein
VKTVLPRAALLLLATATVACSSDDPDGIVARAGDHSLTVDEAVRTIASVPELPAQPAVVGALTELWLDYTLLAEALRQDSTLSQLDFDPAIRAELEQQAVVRLRDSVITADTVVSDDELRGRYEEQTPGARVRARHILLRYPAQATPEQRDSVRSRADALLARLRDGADFAALATEASEDPGSASRGGDLGFFTRGDMVKPFEDAAFAMEPGEVSDVVESPFGLHIIRVEEKEVPSFEDVRADFRRAILTRRNQVAESLYIAELQEEAEMEVVDGAPDLVRQMARDPSTTLSRRAGERTVVEYTGGEVSLSDLKGFLAAREGQYRQQLAQADDETLERFVTGLAQRELLVARAREAGFEPGESVADSLTLLLRDRLREAGRAMGLADIEVRGSETPEQAIDRRVEELLRSIVSGEQELLPLGPLSLVLREEADVLLVRPAFDAVVRGIEQVRGPGGQPATPPPGGAPPGSAGGSPPPAAAGAQPPGGEGNLP